MSEDSIISSPASCNKSIRETRLKRKKQRKKDESEQMKSDHENVRGIDMFINNFYKDLEDESEEIENKGKNKTFLITKPPAIVSNFKPFELEKLLAKADRVSMQQNDRNKPTFLPNTQGFLTCISLTEMEQQMDSAKPLENNNNENSSFSITESELISCCHQVEKNLQLTPRENFFESSINGANEKYSCSQEREDVQLTPKNKDGFCLVNSILEDFSQSPLSKEQTKVTISWQHTPEFRLRRIPLKTYSRKFMHNKKRNLNNLFVDQNLSVLDDDNDDDNESNSSFLSIQENATITEISNNHTMLPNLNNSRLCENLLNLSVYFTQNNPSSENASNDNLSPSHDDINDITLLVNNRESPLLSGNVKSIMKDILTLRCMYPNRVRNNSYSSTEDFLGFSSQKDDEINVNNVEGQEPTTLNIKEVRHDRLLDISLNEKDNAALKDCIDDDCPEIFDCINTESILYQQNVKEADNTIENIEQFALPSMAKTEDNIKSIGFKTASAKPIKVSKEAHIIAAKILSKQSEIPAMEENFDHKNCDTKNLNKDVNIFENPEDYEWNDDCDLFLNLQTPIASKEIVINVPEKHNTNELLYKPQQQLDGPSTSKMALGFKTGAGKSVLISQTAQKSVQKLLSEFDNEFVHPKDNYNCLEELKEMKKKVYAKNHNLESNDVKQINNLYNAEQNSNTNLGFQTARGKGIKISAKAQQSVKKLLSDFTMDTGQITENDLETIKQNIYKKNNKSKQTLSSSISTKELSNNHQSLNNVEPKMNSLKSCEKSNTFPTTNKSDMNTEINKLTEDILQSSQDLKNNKDLKELVLSEWPLETTFDIVKNKDNIQTIANNTNVGFQTARGKEIKISTKAQQSVKKLLSEFNMESLENTENDLETIKQNIYKKNKECKQTLSTSFSNKTKDPQSFSNIKEINSSKSFQNNTSFQINAKNNKETEKILQSVQDIKSAEHSTDFMLSEWPVETYCKTLTKNKDIDCQIANAKYVTVTSNTQQSIENLLQEFNADVDMENYKKDIIEMKNKFETKNKQLKFTECSKNKLKSSPENEFIFSESALCPSNITPKPMKGKRKHSLDSSDLSSPNVTTSPPAKIPHRALYNSKSLLAEKSLKSPLASHSIISRKNLLSLTKSRKKKRNSLTIPHEEIPKINEEKYDLSEDVATPIKSTISERTNEYNSVTPNLKEFFSAAPLTSTPQMNAAPKSNDIINDSDLKPINWRNNESFSNKSSNHTTKLSNNSSLNITLNSSNPTAKERIGRLKMYGKAPPVSPILIETNHNCRPSGLRRTRSMFKKTE